MDISTYLKSTREIRENYEKGMDPKIQKQWAEKLSQHGKCNFKAHILPVYSSAATHQVVIFQKAYYLIWDLCLEELLSGFFHSLIYHFHADSCDDELIKKRPLIWAKSLPVRLLPYTLPTS